MDNQQTTTTEHLDNFNGLVKNQRFVMFTTRSTEGKLVSRPMTIAERENDLFRFSATVRAADTWFGMNWVAYEKLSVKQANAALVATLELSDRLKLREKLERLIELARREREDRNTTVYLMRPDPGWLELDRARPADLLDAVQPEPHSSNE